MPLIGRLIKVPSLVSMINRGPISGSGSGAGVGAGSSVARFGSSAGGVSRGVGCRRGGGLRPRVRGGVVVRVVSRSAGFSVSAGVGVSTGFASGVGSGVGCGVGAAAVSVTGGSGSGMRAPTEETRLVLLPATAGSGFSGSGVSASAMSGPPGIGSNEPPKYKR